MQKSAANVAIFQTHPANSRFNQIYSMISHLIQVPISLFNAQNIQGDSKYILNSTQIKNSSNLLNDHPAYSSSSQPNQCSEYLLESKSIQVKSDRLQLPATPFWMLIEMVLDTFFGDMIRTLCFMLPIIAPTNTCCIAACYP